EHAGAITGRLAHSENSPCVLFDEIPGYPKGYRVIVNCSGTPERQAVTLGIPADQGTHEGLRRFWSDKLEGLTPLPPREVPRGPVCENILEGDQIDLEGFPAPVWHPKDGGRFIGTASINI